MKVFADTNFLISAFTARGISADLFELIITDHLLLLSEVVLSEFERVLIEKFKIPIEDVQETIAYLRSEFQVFAKPKQKLDLKLEDEDDEWVLSSAVSASADVLVTGDKHFLKERENIKDIKILTPRELWEKLT